MTCPVCMDRSSRYGYAKILSPDGPSSFRVTVGSVRFHALAFFSIWGFGDTVSTLAAASAVGPSGEANPLMAAALHVGPLPFIVVKILAVGLGTYLFARFSHHITTVPGWWLWAFGWHILGVLVVVTNLMVAGGVLA